MHWLELSVLCAIIWRDLNFNQNVLPTVDIILRRWTTITIICIYTFAQSQWNSLYSIYSSTYKKNLTMIQLLVNKDIIKDHSMSVIMFKP